MRQKKLIENSPSEKEALKILEASGKYSITSIIPEQVTTSNDILVNLFYEHLQKVADEDKTLTLLADKERDLEAIRRFQATGKSSGLSKAESNAKIKYFIEIVFSQYQELGLDNPPTCLAYLLGDGRWIIQKAIVTQKSTTNSEYDHQAAIEDLCAEENEVILEIKRKRHSDLLSLYHSICKRGQHGKTKKQ